MAHSGTGPLYGPSQLSHRNVVQFKGLCTSEVNPYLIIEYAELGSLYKFLRDVRVADARKR